MLTRRDFLKSMGMLGGIILTPLGRLGRWKSSGLVSADVPPAGELYAGFLLLPEGAPVPPIVKEPELGIPIVCGLGVGRGGPEPTAVTKSFNNAADLAKEVHFPMYTLGKLPEGLRPVGGYLTRHDTGEVFSASANFEAYNSKNSLWEGTVFIDARPDFHKPFPLWSSEPVEPGGPAVVLEKVDFLPSPGIMVSTGGGYVFHWIKDDTLYALYAENGPTIEKAHVLVASLVHIGDTTN